MTRTAASANRASPAAICGLAHSAPPLGLTLVRAGQDEPFAIYLALMAMPDVNLYRRFEDAGVTDMICAPWMLAPKTEGQDYRSALDAHLLPRLALRHRHHRQDGLTGPVRSR